MRRGQIWRERIAPNLPRPRREAPTMAGLKAVRRRLTRAQEREPRSDLDRIGDNLGGYLSTTLDARQVLR